MNRRRSRLATAALAACASTMLVPASYGADIKDGTVVDRYFDCSKIYDLGYDKQLNVRARLLRIQCGLEDAAETRVIYGPYDASAAPSSISALGGVDVNTITGTESYPAVTQSESFVWGQGNTIVTTFNDSRTAPGNYSGGSVSTDGGVTFARFTPSPFETGHGTNYGDPTVVFNQKLNLWYASFLATGCGGQGVGLWTSPDGVTWSAGACAHTGSFDDRQSFWVDNTAASPYYGRMYMTWNDFGAGQGIYCERSDDGTTWSLSTVEPAFIRNCQVTGTPDGSVFVAGMDEGGGGLSPRTNIMYRSTDGGATWTKITMGAPFGAPGSVNCGYFEAINPIWRHMGWGQPAGGPNLTIHYPYCGAGLNAGDLGDIYYTRSTDNGSTWSAPIVLNTDQGGGGTTEQWMPSCSVTPTGSVLATWYDRRNTTNGTDYEYWGRISTDNGATWGADDRISDVIAPSPAQPDGNVQPCYVGDYNYQSIHSNGTDAMVTWCDGRNQVNGQNQQDVYFDRVPLLTCNPITVAPATLPGGTLGVPYSQTITASGGTAPYTFAVTAGALPPGLNLAAGGVLSGTPTTLGAYAFTVTATDSAGCQGSQQYSITISCPAITVAPASLPNGSFGAPYSQTITASGGTAPYTFAVTGGALPGGLTLSAGGVLSGTPTASGTFNFVVTATDAGGCTGTQSYTLTIDYLVDTIVGRGLGQPNTNEVRVFTAAGTATSVDFLAYAAGQWGVNVAGGNVNGGAYDEIVSGPGPGPVFGPQVRAFNQAGGGINKVNFYAYGTLRYGVNVGSGGVDADTFDEILTGAGPGPVFGPHVRGWNFDNNALTPIQKISFFAYGTLKYGVNVTTGSVDADGYAELETGPGPGAIFGPQVRGFNYDGSTVTAIAKINFNAYTVLQYGVNVATGDVENDGYAEIGTAPGPGVGAQFPSDFRGFNYDGASISQLANYQVTAYTTVYGGRVGFGDLDTDGDQDLITGAGRDPAATSVVKAYSYSITGLSQLPGQFTAFSGASYGCNVASGALGY
ncbi:MAG: putative Ig domain-containing protein [Acidobacteriota bacterium]